MLVRMMTTLASLLRRQSFPLLLLTCMTLLSGCATPGLEQSTPHVTVSDVIQMSQQGVPAGTILEAGAMVGDPDQRPSLTGWIRKGPPMIPSPPAGGHGSASITSRMVSTSAMTAVRCSAAG
jgi:hypothetical protein